MFTSLVLQEAEERPVYLETPESRAHLDPRVSLATEVRVASLVLTESRARPVSPADPDPADRPDLAVTVVSEDRPESAVGQDNLDPLDPEESQAKRESEVLLDKLDLEGPPDSLDLQPTVAIRFVALVLRME